MGIFWSRLLSTATRMKLQSLTSNSTEKVPRQLKVVAVEEGVQQKKRKMVGEKKKNEVGARTGETKIEEGTGIGIVTVTVTVTVIETVIETGGVTEIEGETEAGIEGRTTEIDEIEGGIVGTGALTENEVGELTREKEVAALAGKSTLRLRSNAGWQKRGMHRGTVLLPQTGTTANRSCLTKNPCPSSSRVVRPSKPLTGSSISQMLILQAVALHAGNAELPGQSLVLPVLCGANA
mmetsp:Transcript_4612/g.8835  ORF Transcript_4612/g.8835 Transcript_4612/m.8835 type:complete len:236 (+) Transcript_4612:825-1532(+)